MGRDIKFDLIYRGETGCHHKKYYLTELMSGIKNICDIHSMMELIAKRQYTGLKDKNGVEIYEKDILRHPYFDNPTLVDWNCDDACFESGGVVSEWDGCEVIGNIYESPELLK